MNELIKEIKSYAKSFDTVIFETKIYDFIAYLIYLKYLCDTGKYKYEDVIASDNLYLLTKDMARLARVSNNGNIHINSLLRVIKDNDIKKLILEFLDYVEKPIEFHNDNDQLLYFHFYRNIFPYYNTNGNATYILDSYINDNYDIFKIFDKVLGINNKYIETKNIDELANYDYVYVYDDVPKYRLSKYNVYNDINIYIKNNKNVVMYTNYNKISNFGDGRIISKYIKTVIINNNKAVMLFNNSNIKDISIISYNTKINSLDKLYTIIKNNRKQKDVLVKTTYEELKENNLRIGFNLYQLEKNNEIRDINKIVDENTEYLNILNIINEKVEKEINVLLNR